MLIKPAAPSIDYYMKFGVNPRRKMREYQTIKAPCERELIIKKSKFIGQLYPVSSFEEAQDKLNEVKKKYWDATHNCSAIIVGEGGEYTRCSDDGEPQGTAGVPMLEALKNTGLTGVLCIVTRYFGGILLGAGGLVRAYGSAVTEVASACERYLYRPYLVYEAELPFKLWGKAQSQILSSGWRIKDIRYTSCVQAQVYIPLYSGEDYEKLLLELSAGTVIARNLGEELVEIKLSS